MLEIFSTMDYFNLKSVNPLNKQKAHHLKKMVGNIFDKSMAEKKLELSSFLC